VLEQWRVLEALGFFEVEAVGLVASLSFPLASANLIHFYFSTFKTGFVLVRASDVPQALDSLRKSDFQIEDLSYPEQHEQQQQHALQQQ
jgi:hypothetical protein